MIFSAFRKPKCVICSRKFHHVTTVVSSDRESMQDALALGEFGCPDCGIQFHGMCGKVGQANPKYAIVTCPRCHRRIRHALPFDVKIAPHKHEKQIGDRLDES